MDIKKIEYDMSHTYLRAREYGGRYYGERRLLNRLINSALFKGLFFK